MLTLTIQVQPNDIAQPDLTQRLTRATFSTNLHGDEALQLSAPISMTNAFVRYDHAGTPHAIITDGAATPFQGRIEDSAIRSDGIDMTAFGYQRAMSDARYTALWTNTRVADWRVFTETDTAILANPATPGRFAFDTNNRIYIAPQKGATLGNTGVTKNGMLGFLAPDQGSRSIIGASFDYAYSAPAANWRFAFQNRNADFSGIANPWIVTTGGGGTNAGSIFVTFAAAPIVNFYMDFNAADAVFAGETGSAYLRITNLRLVTSTTNMINTTHTAARGAGVNVTATVGSTARMYVGQRLFIGAAPPALGESVIVKQILSSTQFVADFTAAAAIGVTVQAFVIYADEIARDLISTVTAQNPVQLLPDTTQVTSPALDLFDAVYEDQPPSAVLDRLITLGDSAGTAEPWEWGVTGGRILFYRAPGAISQDWYVDASAITVQRSLNNLINSAYAVYQDANGRTLRSAVATDAASVTRIGITRTQEVAATTTSLIQATVQRDATIDDKADPAPRFGLTFNAVYNRLGGRAPLWLPRAGDTITIRNLPPTISVSSDQLRTFRIARTTCDLIARTLTVEPIIPLPSVQVLLARDARRQA